MGSGGWRMSYDPEARRDTPLALKLKERIRRDGAITLDAYMIACPYDPDYGYYTRQPAIGRDGDFITAPEISQTFGELTGLWCAVVWQSMGSPKPFNLIELGPGRGTLMADALKAARIVPDFAGAAAVHLIESNTTLRDAQQKALAGAQSPITWHANASQALRAPQSPIQGPAIIIANEYLDTFPIEQSIFADGQWLLRTVALDGGDCLMLATGGATRDTPPDRLQDLAKPGDVFEYRDGFYELADDLARKGSGAAPLAALFIDYGHIQTALGDTLQGVKSHRQVPPFETPGETDLTAQVDFEAFGTAMTRVGFIVDGPVTQAEFLGRLGIIERASKLMTANPEKAAEIEAGVARLIAPNGMGTRFKAIGIRSAGLPPLPGFA